MVDSMNNKAFAIGDIVKHRGKFLRSIAWSVGVPVNGIVRELGTLGGKPFVHVEWSHGHTAPILAVNVELDPKMKR